MVEFSILFIMIFYGKAIKNSLESISQITFSNSENEKLKTLLISHINSNRAEKEIENEAIKINPNLVENIVENSNLKLIVNKKNYEQIKELFEDFMNDLIEGQNKKDRISREEIN